MLRTFALAGSVLALCAAASFAEDRLRDPAGLRQRVAGRAVRELVGGKLHAGERPITEDSRTRTGLHFLYGQATPKVTQKFTKHIANIRYTRDRPQRQYVVEETKGELVFNWYAAGATVTIEAPATADLRPRGWGGGEVPDGREIAAKYSREQAESRARNNRPGGPSTRVVFLSKRWYLGAQRSDLNTLLDVELFATHDERDYLGATGEVIAYHVRGTHQGPPLEFYNGLIYAVTHGDFVRKIEARAVVPVWSDWVRITLSWEELRHPGVQERLMTVGEADRIMTALVRMIYEELGLPVPAAHTEGPGPEPPSPPAPPPPPVPPVPVPATPPDPVPHTTPPRDRTPPVQTPPALPDAPKGGPHVRIAEMIALLAPLETDLQAGLLRIKVIADAVRKLRSQVLDNQRLLTGDNPLNKDLIREELAGQRRELKSMHRYLDRQIEVTLGLLDDSVARLETTHATGGFGELTNHADQVLRAARDRRDLLQGQVHLMTGDQDRLRAFTARLRGEIGGTAKAHFFEALASLQQDRPIVALQSLREARGWGLRPGEGAAPGTTSSTYGATMSGETVEMLQRELEVRILDSLQERATGDRDAFERDFFAEADRRGETDRERGTVGTWFKRLFRTGLYDAGAGAGGTIQEFFTGDSSARAREEEIGVLGDEVAKTHIALGTLKGLRRSGHRLEDIARMDRATFHAAVETTWGSRVTPQEADRLRQVLVSHALSLPTVRALTSGDDLTAAGVLDGEVVQTLDESGWAQVRSFGKAATNMVDGWILATTLAPAARFGRLGGRAGVAAEVTVGEYFAASGAAQSAVATLSRSKMGQRALTTAQRVRDFADSSTSRAVRVFVYETAGNALASHAVRQQLGEEAQMAFDLVQMTGATTSRFWSEAMQTARMSAGATRNASQRLLESARRVESELTEASLVNERLRRAIAEAGEGAPDAAALTQARRTVQQMHDLPEPTARRLLAAVEDASNGRTLSALEHLDGASRQVKNAVRGTAAARRNAARLREAAEEMLDDLPPASTRQEVQDVAKLEPTGGRTRVGTRTEIEAGDLAKARARVRRGAAPKEHASPRLLTQDASAPTHRADVLMAQQQFARARAEYRHLETLLDQGLVDPDLAPAIARKLQWAEAADEAARMRAAAPDGPTRPMNAQDRDLVRQAILNTEDPDVALEILKGAGKPHLEGIGKGASGKSYVIDYATEPGGAVATSSTGKPMYRRVAVVKELPDGDVEGWAEEIASRMMEKAGRRGPHTRIVELEVRGKVRRYLVTKGFEPGVDMDRLDPGFADLLAHKGDLADDLAYRLVLGDGDVHLGNLRVLDDGSVMGFDYGGADLFPTHPRYRRVADLEAVAEDVARYRARLQQMTADPARFGVDGAAVQEATEALDRATRSFGMDPPPRGADLPYTPFDEARARAVELADALKKLGDPELAGADVTGLFNKGYVGGLYQHPGFRGNPLDYGEDELLRWAESSMQAHFNHATHQWGDRFGIVRSAMDPGDFATAVTRLRERVLPEIDDIVDAAMRGVPEAERAFTKRLMRARIEALDTFLRRKFPNIPRVVFLQGARRTWEAAA